MESNCTSATPEPRFPAEVSISGVQSAYLGFFKIESWDLLLKNGHREKRITRELFARGHAAAVLIYDPALDRVLLVDELRIGNVAARLPQEHWVSPGPVAGMIEQKDSPVATVLREAQEEAGLTLSPQALVAPITILPSPGGSSEMVTLMIGLADLCAYQPGIHGLIEEGELTVTRLVSREDALAELEARPQNGHLALLLMRLEVWRLSGRLGASPAPHEMES